MLCCAFVLTYAPFRRNTAKTIGRRATKIDLIRTARDTYIAWLEDTLKQLLPCFWQVRVENSDQVDSTFIV